MNDEIACNDRGLPLAPPAFYKQVYTTLQHDEIRTLLLGPGSEADPIDVELEVIRSTKSRQYEAVSYVWGPTRADRAIKCNKLNFTITESLHIALLHLRYPSTWRRLWVDQLCIDQFNDEELMGQVRKMGAIYSHSSRVVVWLGMQDKTMSQAWQVVQETYHSPSLVRSDFLAASPGTDNRDSTSSRSGTRKSAVRPGSGHMSREHSTPTKSVSSRHRVSSAITRPFRPSANTSTTSLSSSISSLSSFSSTSSLSSTSDNSQRTPIRKNRSSCRSFSLSKVDLDLNAGQTPPSPRLKLALSIFQHLYFTRLWTFQEIVLAPAAILVSDGIEFALADLMGWYFHHVSKPAFSRTSDSSRALRSMRAEALVYDSIGSFENIIHLRHEIAKAEPMDIDGEIEDPKLSETLHGVRFSTLLMLTRHLQSLKAEDRVLSLLGLHQGFADYLATITEAEGWLPVPELFLTAFRYCIEVENSLDILSAAGIYTGNTRKGFEGWPSWLPDWREFYPLRPLVLDNSKIASGRSSDADTKQQLPHRACSNAQIECQIAEDDEGRFSFSLSGCRVGVIATKLHSWPGRYIIADPGIRRMLEQSGLQSNTHTQSTPNLLGHSTDTSALDDYASMVISEALQQNSMCDAVNTFASTQTGDWVCFLNGGPVLYILRPIRTGDEDDHIKDDSDEPISSPTPDQHKNSAVDNTSDKASIPSFRCRYIGECAVNVFSNGFLADELLNVQREDCKIRFELI